MAILGWGVITIVILTVIFNLGVIAYYACSNCKRDMARVSRRVRRKRRNKRKSSKKVKPSGVRVDSESVDDHSLSLVKEQDQAPLESELLRNEKPKAPIAELKSVGGTRRN